MSLAESVLLSKNIVKFIVNFVIRNWNSGTVKTCWVCDSFYIDFGWLGASGSSDL